MTNNEASRFDRLREAAASIREAVHVLEEEQCALLCARAAQLSLEVEREARSEA